MSTHDGWRAHSPVSFDCEKAAASGRSVVVANHPLGTAAGVEMLAAGGNAVDAAVATLFALTVVEPMMVGIAGGGLSHVRLPDGRHHVIDAMSVSPADTHPAIFEPVSDEPARRMETVNRRSAYGPSAVAVPGNLVGWTKLHGTYGKLPFSDLLEPAIRLARRGFQATHYLAGAVGECAADIAADEAMASVFMPDGQLPSAGTRIVQNDYAESLRLIQTMGACALHDGPLGDALVSRIHNDDETDGWLREEDLYNYEAVVRTPIVGNYRGFEVVGPPPPASSGVHVAQMLNMIEHFDVRGEGFGTPAALSALVSVLGVAMADRAAFSGDPAFVDVPVERLISKEYAAQCWAQIKAGAREQTMAHTPESANTTHITVADRDGMIVTATHTINGIFGARFMVPEAGFIPNNYMMNFDPHPGRALSVAPGKRVPTSMAPMIVRQNGKPVFALGLPGGVRIFPSAFQSILNLLDHRMSVQEAVEAPRLWTDGHEVEVEALYGEPAADALRSGGHALKVVPHIGGGMNAVSFGPDGVATGAACWRADGTVGAIGGGLARPGVRFWPGRSPDQGEPLSEAKPPRNAGPVGEASH
ncbi:gamma-glutamyltransferase [Acuticoccus sp. MNP-M23]|uniref:gamma-glutamyltransferase n=1 Tax=Acuticoccus sp. MNP-M23 TaxID=3072793 RepID=UPI002814FBB4|nr:gamma-glutamyltransferase [Acuticoccus sp. MNP-M23]WMS43496.1 gamma-glutamyltransferase [Acuticoccus sp. MNP-M23]